MKDTFHIDRASGTTIFIEVKDGVVEDITCGAPKFNAKMKELYMGHTIAFLKHDFETRMSPCYVNVRPDESCGILQRISTAKTALMSLEYALRMLNKTKQTTEKGLEEAKAKRDQYLLKVEEHLIAQQKAELELNSFKTRMIADHGYEMK
jgi:hypothetical protein